MVTFEDGIDARCREATKPTVARFRVKGSEYRYIVIGTQYGYLHTAGGDVRTWASRSGAYKAAKSYVAL